MLSPCCYDSPASSEIRGSLLVLTLERIHQTTQQLTNTDVTKYSEEQLELCRLHGITMHVSGIGSPTASIIVLLWIPSTSVGLIRDRRQVTKNVKDRLNSKVPTQLA